MNEAVAAAPARAQEDPRIEVWLALSDLYLDNETADIYDYVAETLASSPFALDALHDMLMYDVHPVLYPNLMIVAGEWAGFDREWLIARIAEVRAQARWRRRITHVFVRSIHDEWREVVARIAAIRGARDAERGAV
jgi:hypothetical protein